MLSDQHILLSRGRRVVRPPRAYTCAMQLPDAPATPLTYLRHATYRNVTPRYRRREAALRLGYKG